MKRYNRMPLNEVCDQLMRLAQGAAVLYHDVIVGDMVVSLAGMYKYIRTDGQYYFAIREMGVESGTMEHVIERCEYFGNPFVVAKVTCGSVDYNLSLATTNGNDLRTELNAL